ncbi:MAG: GNAT family N-acetyltransferase [Trebonia sp.]
MTTDIPAALIERVEAEAYAEFSASAATTARDALGTRQLRIGGGVALAMPYDSSGFFSKTIGLGFAEPITAQLLSQIIEFYREQGMPSASLRIAPRSVPADWAGICAKLGLREEPPGEVKLVGDLRTLAAGSGPVRLDAGLRVVQISPGQVEEWARVMFEGYGLPVDPHHEMAIGVYGKPGWYSFAVLEGDAIIAAANLYVHGSVADLFGSATLPKARRRGAQSALIAARIATARDAGCTWLLGDTDAEGPGEHNSSLHNMLRAGLDFRYLRQNWTWG